MTLDPKPRSLRVLIVEDSLTVRRHLADTLAKEPGFEVVAEAGTGEDAVRLCQALRPDVVTLDMVLPGMTGLEVTEEIMAHWPTPILIVSSSANRGEVFQTYDALARGAIDVFDKPSGRAETLRAWELELIERIKRVAKVPVITHVRGKSKTRRVQGPPTPGPMRGAEISLAGSTGLRCAASGGAAARLVAIGASAGGPHALQHLAKTLRADFPLPMLVVLHLSKTLGWAFAEWLASQGRLPVRFAKTGEELPPLGQPGMILAPPDHHMRLVTRPSTQLVLDQGPERHSCRPSVDALFESLARELPGQVAAFLLTGMGQDGARGLLELRRAGSRTYAQDAQTSMVHGMPAAALQCDAAERVVSLFEIPGILEGLAVRFKR